MSFIQLTFTTVRNTLNAFAASVHRYRNWYLAGATVGCSGAVFRHLYYDWAISQGPSMYPTMPDHAHTVLLDRRCKKGRDIQVGDVIHFAHPQFPRGQYACKRVLGLPGDYVVRDPPVHPSVGGAAVKGVTDWRERLLQEEDESVASAQVERQEPEIIQVPEGHVWVVGDNMAWSRDSRTFGPVPMALIGSRVSSLRDGYFNWTSLNPRQGLRKVEEWEMDAVLGDGNSRERQVTRSNTSTKAKEDKR